MRQVLEAKTREPDQPVKQTHVWTPCQLGTGHSILLVNVIWPIELKNYVLTEFTSFLDASKLEQENLSVTAWQESYYT